MSRTALVVSAVTNQRSAPAARFWVAIARDCRCPSRRRVVIIATSISSIWLYSTSRSDVIRFFSLVTWASADRYWSGFPQPMHVNPKFGRNFPGAVRATRPPSLPPGTARTDDSDPSLSPSRRWRWTVELGGLEQAELLRFGDGGRAAAGAELAQDRGDMLFDCALGEEE